MDNKIILTIGRQFGSGGREVGQKLAKELGIGYYDKELMALAAKESGLSEEFFEKADEKASSGLAYAFTMGYSYMGKRMKQNRQDRTICNSRGRRIWTALIAEAEGA